MQKKRVVVERIEEEIAVDGLICDCVVDYTPFNGMIPLVSGVQNALEISGPENAFIYEIMKPLLFPEGSGEGRAESKIAIFEMPGEECVCKRVAPTKRRDAIASHLTVIKGMNFRKGNYNVDFTLIKDGNEYLDLALSNHWLGDT